jgi:hypothetical protein
MQIHTNKYILMLIVTIFFLTLLFLILRSSDNKIEKEDDRPPLLTCIYCEGTGERIEDHNYLMFMGKFSLYMNKHREVDKCKECNKLSGSNDCCSDAKKQYLIFLEEYKALGPKFENTICSECMGGGQFKILTKNPKTNKWYTQEDYEEKEKEKQNTKKNDIK